MKPGMSMRQSINGYAGMPSDADITIHDSIRLDGHIVGLIRSFFEQGKKYNGSGEAVENNRSFWVDITIAKR